jgi:DNA helicase-2/ATP-dependent DNA helicase PcrA
MSLYDKIYADRFQKLNEGQKAAVNSIEGPVLVNAGPGTGKTQILAMRIGKILSETDTAAHNILCLTFTDAATIAMRNRLVKIIGPTAHQVHIFTFHAFCNQVIQENLNIFGGCRQLEPVTDLELIEILQKLADDLPNDNILKRFKQDKYFEVRRMKNLFNLMKSENISAPEFHEIIKKHIEELRESEQYIAKRKSTRKGITYHKGDFRDDKFNEDVAKFDELAAAVDEFDKFQKLMFERERYDYNDMILWVLKEFRENELLLLQYQERYHYFLVDEFQDTNGAQNAILAELISYWDQPNVFAVGDDDQAIFKFQGANLRNLIDFKSRYHPHTIVLEENYRSNQWILDAARHLIEKNEERIINEDPSLSKKLIASGPYREDDTKPVIHVFKKHSEEYAYLARRIEQIQSEDLELLKDTAILYRQHKQVEELIEIFEKRNIPYNVKRRVNVLELPFAKNLIALLKYIQEEYDKPYSASYGLFDLLHFSYFGIKARDIAKLAKYANSTMKTENPIRLRDLIGKSEEIEKLQLESGEQILELSEKLESWIADQRNMTIQKLFEKILNEGQVLEYVIHHEDKVWLLQVINTLFDFIKEETARDPELDLSTLLAMIDKMLENRIELPVLKNISSEQGVNLITAHSAKGLQFKNVFMIACSKKYWDKMSSSRGHYSYPANVNTSSNIDIEDERRLFFVGMTRAKTHLYLSYSEKSEDNKDLGATRFIDELLETDSILLKEMSVEEEVLVQYYYDILKKAEKKIELVDKNLIDEWLKDYKLSVTHLNKYLRCPISFYFENVLRVPSARNASTGFGTAMHGALFDFLMHYQKKGSCNKEMLLRFFEDNMDKRRSHFTHEEFSDYMIHGKKNLAKVYDDRMESWLKVPKFALEEELSHAEADGIPIKGFLDKVEIYENHVNVIDYKTGNASNGMKKTKRPSERDPIGGDYWRQLVFYKLLLESDRKHNWKLKTAEIDFLEPDRKTGEFKDWKYDVKDEDVVLLKEQIRECYENITAHNFDTGCGEVDCKWCQFVEKNEMIQN